MVLRLAVAALLLATVGAGLWWVASSAPAAPADEVGRGEFRLVVVWTDGTLAVDRLVDARATPFDVLLAGAAAGNFTVDVERQPWIGSGCTAEYVRGIAGQGETTTGGWNYYVRSPGGTWEWKPAGAACHVLHAGDEVEWCWVELDVCGHHAP